ncbi:nitrile hydratase subunit beta [Phyllobacterium sp. LjRoot231]|uniref:hypothetical protein n=1 Tax=Phyllobacterium sp. LjRoot231 TaxID=3342289 RepID=UPI003ECC38BF
MHAANLQIEGLCLAIASINRLLVERGVVTQEELDTAFDKAEATARGDNRFTGDMSPSNRDAVCFPIRVLQVANDTGAEKPWSFSELAKLVAETKEPYNDQR